MKTVIDKSKIAQMLAKGALLADMRSPIAYRDGHAVGAVNLPLKNFVNKIMGLPKTTALVMYSDSITDSELLQARNYAEQLGFKKITLTTFAAIK